MKRRKHTIVVNKFIVLCIILSFLLITVKLGMVTLLPEVDGIDLTEFASNRNTVEETLYAKRGTIYDVNGDPLGQTVNSYTVIAYLSSRRTTNVNDPQHVVDKEQTAAALAPILNTDAEILYGYLSQENKYQVELGNGGKGISELTKSEIEKLNLPGIDFIASTKRYYPLGSFAPYIIGYARKNDEGKIVGYMGIESYFNLELTGQDGKEIYQQDAYGYQIPSADATIEEPISGQDIYLTLDSQIQLFAENAISTIIKDHNIEWVTLSVMDGKTGAILAAASSPTFNLNTLEIQDHKNPLTAYAYEPGSTMKIFSFAAAIEEGIYDGEAEFLSGKLPVDDFIINDFNGKGWGVIDYDTGFTYSSNVAASNLALELGSETLLGYYDRLGFGKKTGITLAGEVKGQIIPNYPSKTALATAGYGHGITTTPIQNLQALSFLANDGVVIKPYIVDKIVDGNTGDIVFQGGREEIGRVASSTTTDYMIELMRDVITTKRTDAYVYQPDSVEVIGKTGTAQIPEDGGYAKGEYAYVRSFAGLFPYNDPQYVIYISVSRYEGPIRVVGNAVASLIAEIAKYKNVESTNETPSETQIIDIPSYLSLDVSTIEERLKKQKLTPVIIGNGKYIIKQYPLNKKVVSGSKVFLYTNGTEIKMPDITGWSRNEISTFCNLTNINCTIEGYGTVIKSSLGVDTVLTPAMNVLISLGKKETEPETTE